MPDYLVRTLIAESPDRVPVQSERLVRAANKARAIAHVVADTIKVDVATSDDVMRVAKAGGEIEVARDGE